MEIRHQRYFVTVAEEQDGTRAPAQLRLTQPSCYETTCVAHNRTHRLACGRQVHLRALAEEQLIGHFEFLTGSHVKVLPLLPVPSSVVVGILARRRGKTSAAVEKFFSAVRQPRSDTES
jgi:DNA-binding transcriptional LysR family regulator